jgi:hypothetical protein
VVHCGACMVTKRVMCVRAEEALDRNVPITNYGVTISYVQGVLPRVLEPFGGIDALL